MTKIIGLKIQNVKRITAMELVFNPEKNFVVLGGRNEQGKSSTLDALEMVLRGKKAMPPEPVRKGKRKLKVEANLDNGDRIKRTVDASTGKDTLVVTDKDGAKVPRPQTYLDGMLGPIFFDPEDFSRMDSTKQNETLRKLIGLDTTKLDFERDKLYAERTEENREVKRLRTLVNETPRHEGVPAEEVSVADLSEGLEELMSTVADNNALRAEATGRATKATEADASLSEANRVVIEAQAALDRAHDDLVLTREHSVSATEASNAAAEGLLSLTDPNLDEVRDRIATAEATNKLVRENLARAETVDKLSVAEDNAEVLTDDIREIDDEKTALIANAKMPIEGLGFDGDIVTYQGLPFSEQASQSARLKVSASIGIAMNPGIRVLLLRDGSRLDAEGMAALEEVANKDDTLMLVEMVTRNEADEQYCTYVIEDGTVRAPK